MKICAAGHRDMFRNEIIDRKKNKKLYSMFEEKFYFTEIFSKTEQIIKKREAMKLDNEYICQMLVVRIIGKERA